MYFSGFLFWSSFAACFEACRKVLVYVAAFQVVWIECDGFSYCPTGLFALPRLDEAHREVAPRFGISGFGFHSLTGEEERFQVVALLTKAANQFAERVDDTGTEFVGLAKRRCRLGYPVKDAQHQPMRIMSQCHAVSVAGRNFSGFCQEAALHFLESRKRTRLVTQNLKRFASCC